MNVESKSTMPGSDFGSWTVKSDSCSYGYPSSEAVELYSYTVLAQAVELAVFA